MAPVIVREHHDFLIVDKPAGWLVHPTRPDGTFTLIDWLREQFLGEFLALVSRLDRETSGLLLVARSHANASTLGKMQQRREIHKTYLAIVHGRPPESGRIDAPLDRLGKHQPSRIYIRQAVVPETYPAITNYRTLETRHHPKEGVISLVEACPKTGRLHQIRAHFDYISHPVLNDKIYGKKDEFFLNYIDKDNINSTVSARHCLHSNKICFNWMLEANSDLGRTCEGKTHNITSEIGLPADLGEIWDMSQTLPA